MADTYRIVRFFGPHMKRKAQRRNLPRGLTLEQAQEHCSRDDTHAYHWEGVGEDRRKVVDWFDGYEKE